MLADICGEGMRKKPAREIKRKNFMSISDLIMKQCRLVLRRVAAADNAKVLCNLLGRTLISSNDNDDEGILGYPAMVSRPFDFRMIDLRLAVVAIGGCREAFFRRCLRGLFSFIIWFVGLRMFRTIWLDEIFFYKMLRRFP